MMSSTMIAEGGANLTIKHVLRRRSEFLTTHKLNVISVPAEAGASTPCVASSMARTRISSAIA